MMMMLSMLIIMMIMMMVMFFDNNDDIIMILVDDDIEVVLNLVSWHKHGDSAGEKGAWQVLSLDHQKKLRQTHDVFVSRDA